MSVHVAGAPRPKHSVLLNGMQTKKEECLGGEGGWLFQASRPCPWDELGRVPEALSRPALVLWAPARASELFSIVLGEINTR